MAVLHHRCAGARTISECIALLPADSTATIDPDFAKDVEAAVESHREPLSPPEWDSSVLVAAERKGPNARQVLASTTGKIVEAESGISVIT